MRLSVAFDSMHLCDVRTQIHAVAPAVKNVAAL